eukprot:135156_1
MSSLKAIQFAKQNYSKLKLKCGRDLVYSEYGAPNGFPLIHFHGALSSRLEALSLSNAAFNRDIKIICADRPGCGLSDIDPNITYESFSNDIKQLLNHLNISSGSFGFSGISQGGSYVLSNLYFLKELKPQIGVLISSVSQYKSNEFNQSEIDKTIKNCSDLKDGGKLAIKYPPLFYLRLKIIEYILNYAPHLIIKQIGNMTKSTADSEFFAKQEKLDAFVESMKYSMHKYGTKGWIKMMSNMFHEWGFNLKDIDIESEKILCYHGSDDQMCPIEWQQLLANKLNYEVKIFQNEGHLMIVNSKVVNKIFDDIVDTLNKEQMLC